MDALQRRHCHLAPIFAMLALTAVGALGQPGDFTMSRLTPHDAMLLVNTKPNPEREFIEAYWQEVFDTVAASGVYEDVWKLVGDFLPADKVAEARRLEARATELVGAINFDTLGDCEMAFVERMPMPSATPGGGLNLGPVQMVWVFRGDHQAISHNADALRSILRAIVDEINLLSGAGFVLRETDQGATRIAHVDFLEGMQEAPSIMLAIAQHDDLLVIAFGKELFRDVLQLIEKPGSMPSLAGNPSFQAAFEQLPPAEDSVVFFSLTQMLKPMRKLADEIVIREQAEGDVFINTHQEPPVARTIAEAVAAYQRKDYRKALEKTREAHEIAPDDPIVLYNLACFTSLLGRHDEALDWLEKAVDAGFYAPNKISTDSDLDALHQSPRYVAALKKAARLAHQHSAQDIIRNSRRTGEIAELSAKAWEVYQDKEYEKALKLVQQAHEIDPSDSRVLYYLACFHTLVGNEDKALSYLERAVEGGFYCPQHIERDPDLESLRGTERYQGALSLARAKAAAAQSGKSAEWQQHAGNIIDRIFETVSMVDYIAGVESTEGHDVHSHTLTMLAKDAKQRAFYRVLDSQRTMTEFDRFLPQETESFSVSAGMDIVALYDFILESIKMAGPDASEMLTMWEGMQQQFGFSLKDDILGWIDGTMTTVTLADGNTVWMMKVTDEERARQQVASGLKMLSETIMKLSAETPALGMLVFQLTPTVDDRLDGFQNLHLPMSPKPIVWGVTEGHLMFATSSDAAILCLETARGEHPGIRENTRLMGEAIIPDGPFVAVALADWRKTGDEIAEVIGAMSMVSGMAGAFIPDPQVRPIITRIAGIVAKLTPAAREIDFYRSNASLTTFDGQAWHTRSVTHYVPPSNRSAETDVAAP